MDPFFKNVLQGLGGVVREVIAKAGAAAVDSVLDDADATLTEGQRRVRRARERVRTGRAPRDDSPPSAGTAPGRRPGFRDE